MIQPELLLAVRTAGKELLRRYNQREIVMHSKDAEFGGASLVTDADHFSENALFGALRHSYPDDSIQCEEGSSFKCGPAVWHVDPLDGTSNFIRGIPLWGIATGRATNGVPDIGIIYLPYFDQLFVAEKGKGATCNGKPIHVSKRALSESLYFGAGYGGGKQYHSPTLSRAVQLTKILGSSAYEICFIAQGDGEIYELHNVPHDVVAGAVLVGEAGGRVTDKQGNPYTTASKDVLITNGVVHAEVLKLLNRENS